MFSGIPLPSGVSWAGECASVDKVCHVDATTPRRQDTDCARTHARGLEHHQELAHRGHHPHHGPAHTCPSHTGIVGIYASLEFNCASYISLAKSFKSACFES